MISAEKGDEEMAAGDAEEHDANLKASKFSLK